jgi:NitT/TauT family transport system substrate-binding protein
MIRPLPLRRLGVVLSLLGAIALAAPAGSQTTAPRPVRVGGTPAESYLQASMAQELGLFQKAGLSVEVQNQANGPTVAAAVASGNLDVGLGSTITVANAAQRGLPFVIIAPSVMTHPKAPVGLMCVGKSSTVRGPKDLEGKTIALAGLRQAGDLSTRAWLAKGGVDVAKVQLVEVPFAEMGAGLERGTYAAANISEPMLSQAIKLNGIRCIGDPYATIGSTMTLGVWYTTREFAQKNPEVVRKIAQVALETGRWLNSHHDESAAIVSRLSKMDIETIRGEVRPMYAETLNPRDLQPQLDIAFKYGFLSSPMQVSDILFR